MTETQQVWLVIAAVYAGLLIATCIIGTIIYDLIADRKGWKSVSRETLQLASTIPIVGYALVGILMFVIGVLIGHLFFPQII